MHVLGRCMIPSSRAGFILLGRCSLYSQMKWSLDGIWVARIMAQCQPFFHMQGLNDQVVFAKQRDICFQTCTDL